jgi:hypothetical protein
MGTARPPYRMRERRLSIAPNSIVTIVRKTWDLRGLRLVWAVAELNGTHLEFARR